MEICSFTVLNISTRYRWQTKLNVSHQKFGTLNLAPFTRPNVLWHISCIKCFLNVNLSKNPNLHGQKVFDKRNLTKKFGRARGLRKKYNIYSFC